MHHVVSSLIDAGTFLIITFGFNYIAWFRICNCWTYAV